MFWLIRWSYLITSSSSSILLLDILIFSQWCLTVFVLFFNWLHSATSLADNSIEYFFQFEVNFFQLQKRKNNPVQGKEIIVFLVGVLAQSCGKLSEVDSGAFTATKICTPGCCAGKILSTVKNSQNLLKINWNLFLALQPEFLKIIFNLPKWKSKIKGMHAIWALDAM